MSFDPARRQARYEGSFRQRRARTLRLVSGQPRRGAELDDEAVAALARDGLVEVRAGLAATPAEQRDSLSGEAFAATGEAESVRRRGADS